MIARRQVRAGATPDKDRLGTTQTYNRSSSRLLYLYCLDTRCHLLPDTAPAVQQKWLSRSFHARSMNGLERSSKKKEEKKEPKYYGRTRIT